MKKEPQQRKSRSCSTVPSSRSSKPPPPPPCSPHNMQGVSIQPAPTAHHGSELASGAWSQLQPSTPHIPAETEQLLRGILSYCFFSRTEDQQLWWKHSTLSQRRDYTFDNYPFEHYSSSNIHFYQPAGHANLTVFNSYHFFIKELMRCRNKS